MVPMNMVRRLMCVAVSIAVAGCFALFINAVPAHAATSYGEVKIVVNQSYGEAQQVLKLINKERKKAGLGKLKMDKALTKSSIQRAAEVGVYVPWTSPHRRPNGKLATTANRRFVYECCAEGQGLDSEDIVERWMDSPSHRAGILLKSAKSVGIACVTFYGVGISSDRIWVLNFSNTKAKSVQKSKKWVTYTKKVKAKSAYLKKKFFSMYCAEMQIAGSQHSAFISLSSKYNVTTTRVAVGSFKWKSSNPSIATVSKKGVVTAIAPGKVTITAQMKKNPKIKIKKTIEVFDDGQDSSEDEENDDVYLMAAKAA